MDAPNLRPRLTSFRLLAFNCANNTPNLVGNHIGFEMTPAIEMALGVPVPPNDVLEGLVKIEIKGRAALIDTPDQAIAEFSATYEARYTYPAGVSEAEVAARFEREPHQYMLAAQAFPLASSHFRRELMAMGFTVGNMALGL